MKFVSFAGVALPKFQSTYSDNAGNKILTTTRLPGKDGGFRALGFGSSPVEIGRLQGTFTLTAENREDMEAKRDAIRGLAHYGLDMLVVQPSDPLADNRFCWAEVNYIGMTQNNSEHTDLWQTVSITWQLADPFFYGGQYGGITFADNYQFNDGLSFGDGSLEIGASGAETDTDVVNYGNAPAWCWFELSPGSGDSCQNPTIERITAGEVADQVAYSGTLTDTDVLSVDGRQQLVQKNGVNAWASISSYKRPELLQIPPGESTIRVKFANAGDAAQLYLWYFDTYR